MKTSVRSGQGASAGHTYRAPECTRPTPAFSPFTRFLAFPSWLCAPRPAGRPGVQSEKPPPAAPSPARVPSPQHANARSTKLPSLAALVGRLPYPSPLGSVSQLRPGGSHRLSAFQASARDGAWEPAGSRPSEKALSPPVLLSGAPAPSRAPRAGVALRPSLHKSPFTFSPINLTPERPTLGERQSRKVTSITRNPEMPLAAVPTRPPEKPPLTARPASTLWGGFRSTRQLFFFFLEISLFNILNT